MPERDQPASGGRRLATSEVLDRLAQRCATLEIGESSGGPPVLRWQTGTSGKIVGSMGRADFERMREAGFVEQFGPSGSWRLSAKGRDAVRRLRSAAGSGVRQAPMGDRPGRNSEESPLAWLLKRQDRKGASLICASQFAAGEKLRADFWFARMTPRVTTSWDALPIGPARGKRGAPGAGVEMSDNTLAARERVHRALEAVGPELAGVLIDVCCHLKGIEEMERNSGWPQRSGKVVLGIALTRLARHYGLPVGNAAGRRNVQARIRHWGSEGYRPRLDVDRADTQTEADEGT